MFAFYSRQILFLSLCVGMLAFGSCGKDSSDNTGSGTTSSEETIRFGEGEESLFFKADELQAAQNGAREISCGQTVDLQVASFGQAAFKINGQLNISYTLTAKADWSGSEGAAIRVFTVDGRRMAYLVEENKTEVVAKFVAYKPGQMTAFVGPHSRGIEGQVTVTLQCLSTTCNADSACGPSEFCMYTEGCGKTISGLCTPKNPICTREWRPVCGCDGKTYGNQCEAFASGVSLVAQLACEEAAPATSKVCQPECQNVGTCNEGWYDSCEGTLLKKEVCGGCKAFCGALNTRSEGWYSTCGEVDYESLIAWEICSKHEKSCIAKGGICAPVVPDACPQGWEFTSDDTMSCSAAGMLGVACCAVKKVND